MESQGHSVYYNLPHLLVFSIKAFPFLVQWDLHGSSWLLIRTAAWVISNKITFMGKYLGSLPFVRVILFLFYLFLCFALLLYSTYK